MNENLLIENGTFRGFNPDIIIPEGVKQIAPLALSALSLTRSLTLPSTLEVFSPCHLRENFDTNTKYTYAFANWSKEDHHLSSVNISSENPYYKSVNGALYSKDMQKLIYQPPNHYNSTVTIPECVTELCEDSACFIEAKQIIFPTTLRRIEAKACCGINLKKSEIPACKIGESAFQGCMLPKLTTLRNEVIPQKAFASCSNVVAIRICDSVKRICNGAFSYTNMEKIYIPPTTEIEGDPFVTEEQRFIETRLNPNTPGGVEYVYETVLVTYTQLTIGTTAGSPAQTFALSHGIPFEEVEDNEDSITEWLGVDNTEPEVKDFGLPF